MSTDRERLSSEENPPKRVSSSQSLLEALSREVAALALRVGPSVARVEVMRPEGRPGRPGQWRRRADALCRKLGSAGLAAGGQYRRRSESGLLPRLGKGEPKLCQSIFLCPPYRRP